MVEAISNKAGETVKLLNNFFSPRMLKTGGKFSAGKIAEFSCWQQAVSLDSLRTCMEPYHIQNVVASPSVSKLVYTEKVKNSLAELYAFLKKPTLTDSEIIKVFKLNEDLCMTNHSMVTRRSDILKVKIVQQLARVLLSPALCSIFSRLFNSWNSSISTLTFHSPTAKTLAKRFDLEENLSAQELKALYNALKKLEQESIDWPKHINRALTILFPYILYLFFFDLFNTEENRYDRYTQFITPIMITLLTATIRQLHYISRIYFSLQYYFKLTQDWLSAATNQEKFADNFQINRLELDPLLDRWENAQLSINFKQQTIPIKTLENKQISIALQNLFKQYKIRYTTFYSRGEGKNVDEVQVYVSDVYYAFAGKSGWRGNAVTHFSQDFLNKVELALAITRIDEVLKRFKRNNYISGFWLDAQGSRYIDYQIHLQQSVAAFFRPYQLTGKDIFRIPVDPNMLTTLETNASRELAALSKISSMPRIPLDGPAHAQGVQSKAKRSTLRSAPEVAPHEPPAPVKINIETWVNAANKKYSVIDDSVMMILDTKNYTNPIYVTHQLKPEQFNSLWNYEAIVTQLEYPKFVPKNGAQGLYLEGDNLIVKVLGTHGKGDVRAYANGYLLGAQGARLYIVTAVDLHAHD